MAQTLTMPSLIHGERTWRRVGKKPYTTLAGRAIELVIWQTECTVCGATFTVTAPNDRNRHERALSRTTCPAHTMTPTERGRLRASNRAEVFQAIKLEKLARR